MDSKAIIYAEIKALADVVRRAFATDCLDNIIAIFKNHSDICIDLSDAELNSVFAPTDIDKADELYTIFSAYDISVPIALSDFFELLNQKEETIVSKPNAFFLRDCSVQDAQTLRNKYGVWVISKDEVSNRMFEGFSYKDSFEPRTLYGTSKNGWANIFSSNNLNLPPSNSLVLYDNHLLDNTLGGKNVGLSNLTHLLDAVLPQNLDSTLSYYILIMCPKNNEEVNYPKVVQWLTDVQNEVKRNYRIAIEFVLARQIIHERILFMNYAYIETGKGFKVFCPYSNRVYGDGAEINTVETNMYLSNPHKAGERKYVYATSRIKRIKEEYKSARENYDNNATGLGITKFVGAPLSDSKCPNRIFD